MTIRRRTLVQTTLAAPFVLGSSRAFATKVQASARSVPSMQAAAHAMNRLGFGPRPGDLERVARDVPSWIESQLEGTHSELPESLRVRLDESVFATMDPIETVREHELRRMDPAPAQGSMVTSSAEPAAETRAQYARQWQDRAHSSRLLRALHSPRQLEEVMVDFWFNHFNVFQGKGFARVLMGHYEHHAIRPFVLGRFRDLLGATAHHPAMLHYLDNWQSVGGVAAERRNRGLNENYARELMELHTLGVDGGYTQRDVTELARMLTGWTFVPPRAPSGQAPPVDVRPPGRSDTMPGFWFNANWHDRGEKLWLGQRIVAAGKSEGDAALDFLARHPATARHVAFKLAQYFVADTPDAALVAQLAQVFSANDGRIVPVLRAIFESEAFWMSAQLGAKMKTPYHYVLSTLRAAGSDVERVQPLSGALAFQGMPLHGCPTPDGYRNTEAAWLNADGLNKRLQFAIGVAAGRLGGDRLRQTLPTPQLMEHLGPLVTAETRHAVQAHAGDPVLTSALVLAGPAMMRR